MEPSRLLAQPRLSVITRRADHELARVHERIEHKLLVDGHRELEVVLGALLASSTAPVPKTLDLIGHSTPGECLLMLGDWVVDGRSPTVTALFRELAEREVLARLGVRAVRLLGCQTADTGPGRATISALADVLGVEVHGTTHLIYAAHYDAGGFREDCRHVLLGSSELRYGPALDPRRERYPRALEVDALPAIPLAAGDPRWSRRIATAGHARDFLQLVRRTDGAEMPGLPATPGCEVALPSRMPDRYHVAQVVLDGAFVRVYPDGDRAPGVVYPVEDPHAMRALVEQLPRAAAG